MGLNATLAPRNVYSIKKNNFERVCLSYRFTAVKRENFLQKLRLLLSLLQAWDIIGMQSFTQNVQLVFKNGNWCYCIRMLRMMLNKIAEYKTR